MVTATIVYLVRHGESEGNTKGFFQGRTDCPLSPNGLLQAKALEERFRDIKYDAIYTSPLLRTRLTAEAVNCYHSLPITQDTGLLEIDGGVFEGVAFDELPQKYPDEFEVWRSTPHLFAAPKSETMAEVYERISKTILRLAGENKGKTIVLVSHGCAIKNALCFAMGLPLEQLEQAPWPDNTSISRLCFDNELGVSVELCDDSSHLEPLGLTKPSYWQVESKTETNTKPREE